MLCPIWYHLYNLKNVNNTHGEVLILVKLQAKSCNFSKINTPPWVFFTFFKLNKWYQIAQRTTYNDLVFITLTIRCNVTFTTVTENAFIKVITIIRTNVSHTHHDFTQSCKLHSILYATTFSTRLFTWISTSL